MPHLNGWKPDLPDYRDYKFKRDKAVALPTKVDLRQQCSPVEDQGDLGSCTANAIAGALEFLEIKDGMPPTDLSRLFVYYNERKIEKTISQDNGAMIRDGIKSLVQYGVCPESVCPYDIAKFTQKPSSAAYTEALKHKITTYQRITTLADMKACLAAGYPFVFGFTVYDGFMSDTVAKTGVLQLPKKTEKVQGGHAVLCVGYDDTTKRVIARNSWGTGWGQAGYFTMPYTYISNSNLADDMWRVTRGTGM